MQLMAGSDVNSDALVGVDVASSHEDSPIALIGTGDQYGSVSRRSTSRHSTSCLMSA
ncbi:hypothetical protein PC128_g26299 [Phytophthora cactorum]|nr:hypothetical protein PC128_g26299 [Phytophthora cactorum]